MPDEDKTFSASFVLDLRILWRQVNTLYTTSMYVTQSWCIPHKIDLSHFRICIITHNNDLFNKTSMYSRSKFCLQKTPIDGLNCLLYLFIEFTNKVTNLLWV